MQSLLAQYLYQYKQCSLPQIGTVSIVTLQPTLIYGAQSIEGIQATIEYNSTVKQDEQLIAFIASQKNINTADANELLTKFSSTIHSLAENERYDWPNVGQFEKVENDLFIFTPQALSTTFYPAVKAIRVIHPNTSHNMVVGETHTNTADMAQQLAGEVGYKKSNWWVAAALFFLLATATIVFYAVNNNGSFFGNGIKIVPTNPHVTYSTY